MTEVMRCGWAGNDPLYQQYHDEQWGEPVHDDRLLFEMLSLEGAQAGLSWITILRRRDGYLAAFDNFQPEIVASYDDDKIATIVQDERIIRHRGKVSSVITNARVFLQIQAEYGSFDTYIWQFVGGETRHNCFQTLAEIPAQTPESETMSKSLKKRGFKFVGPTICYAFMQACGMVNDHTAECFKYACP